MNIGHRALTCPRVTKHATAFNRGRIPEKKSPSFYQVAPTCRFGYEEPDILRSKVHSETKQSSGPIVLLTDRIAK